MTEENPISIAKESVSLVGEVIKAAGKSEDVKKAAANLGSTAVTLTKTINNALLPLAAVNFAFDKAREYFSNKFHDDLQKKAAEIPAENIIEPQGSIAGPALQGLAFTHEEPNLKEMYLNLLKTSMDNRISEDAHPAFVEIIKQLNGTEASLIKTLLTSTGAIPIARVKITNSKTNTFNILLRHLLSYSNIQAKEPVENVRIPSMVDNWVRLGLIEVNYDTYFNDPERYAWVEKRPEYIRFQTENMKENEKIEFDKGLIISTEFGKLFAKAVGMFV